MADTDDNLEIQISNEISRNESVENENRIMKDRILYLENFLLENGIVSTSQ